MEQYDNTKNALRKHRTSSSNETTSSAFSFGIVGNSSFQTPHLNAGNSQTITTEDAKGKEHGKLQMQRQEHSSRKLEHSDRESQ